MAPHSSTLAWKTPWMGEPGGLPSMGSHRVGHDWSDLAAAAAAGVWVQGLYNHVFCIQLGKLSKASIQRLFIHHNSEARGKKGVPAPRYPIFPQQNSTKRRWGRYRGDWDNHPTAKDLEPHIQIYYKMRCAHWTQTRKSWPCWPRPVEGMNTARPNLEKVSTSDRIQEKFLDRMRGSRWYICQEHAACWFKKLPKQYFYP